MTACWMTAAADLRARFCLSCERPLPPVAVGDLVVAVTIEDELVGVCCQDCVRAARRTTKRRD